LVGFQILSLTCGPEFWSLVHIEEASLQILKLEMLGVILSPSCGESRIIFDPFVIRDLELNSDSRKSGHRSLAIISARTVQPLDMSFIGSSVVTIHILLAELCIFHIYSSYLERRKFDLLRCKIANQRNVHPISMYLGTDIQYRQVID
jgi:hypothetical protein